MPDDKVYQPTNILARESRHILNISKRIGVFDFDLDHANDFQMYRLMYRISREVEIGIAEKVIKTPNDFKLNKKAIDDIYYMWNYGGYYAVESARPTNIRWFSIKYPHGDFYEIVKLPSLQGMIPVGKVSDETLFIQIREDMKVKYAFEKTSFVTLISDGGLVNAMSDGAMPKLSPDDMRSLTKETHFIVRSVYNKIMQTYNREMTEAILQLSVNFQKLIEFDKNDGLSQFSELLGGGNVDSTDPYAINDTDRNSNLTDNQ